MFASGGRIPSERDAKRSMSAASARPARRLEAGSRGLKPLDLRDVIEALAAARITL